MSKESNQALYHQVLRHELSPNNSIELHWHPGQMTRTVSGEELLQGVPVERRLGRGNLAELLKHSKDFPEAWRQYALCLSPNQDSAQSTTCLIYQDEDGLWTSALIPKDQEFDSHTPMLVKSESREREPVFM